MPRFLLLTLFLLGGCTSRELMTDGDAGLDAASAIDGGSDAASIFVDAGRDASFANDGGHDAFVGHDAFSPQDDASIGTDADVDTGEPMCPAGMRVCECATGYYCLHIGASCLLPTAPCPG